MTVAEYDFEQALEDIISRIKEYYPDILMREEKLLRDAYDFAMKAHGGQLRFSGEPYFMHPVEATKILLSINPDVETVAACLLHDVIEDTPVTAEQVGELFGEKIQFLCEGVAKVAKVKLAKADWQSQKFENFQKLFIAMAQDIRVIFVKLADRIHNLRTLEHVRPDKQLRIARESRDVYAEVANQLGLFNFKSEIEDLCFAIIEPKDYARIFSEVAETKKVRRKYIEQARREILKAARLEGFSENLLQVIGREKNLYSVYKKMNRKGLAYVDDVFDILGLRMVVKSKEDCYRALGIVHGRWRPIPGRFKDYISVPKHNGYRSLHTTVLGLGQAKIPTEIQIRTEQMHIDGEYGPAAHWAYKKTGSSDFDAEYLERTAWLPRDLQEHKPLAPEQFFEEVSRSIFSDRVYVFTPKGDLKFLSRGATPVDFAYAIHTEVGDTCVGAMINGVIRPLDTALQNGDVVQILTKVGRPPNAQWLNFVRSSSARHKIMAALRRAGEPEIPTPPQMRPAGGVSARAERKKVLNNKVAQAKPEMIIGGETNLAYRFATCCDSEHSRHLVAYKSRGLQFVVHDAKCQELVYLEPERMFDAHFLIVKKMHVLLQTRVGLLHDCTAVFATCGMDVIAMRTQVGREGRTVWDLEIGGKSEHVFDEMLEKLSRVPGVLEVEIG